MSPCDLRSILNEKDVDPTESFHQSQKEKDSFMERLHGFWQQSGESKRIPRMGHKSLDLHALYNSVQSFGGFFETERKTGVWAKIWKRLPNYDSSITDASSRLRKHYKKLLLDFELEMFPDREDKLAGTKRLREEITNSKPKKQAIQKSANLPRNDDGTLKLPLNISRTVTLHQLGTLKELQNGSFPIGFQSSRMFSSYLHPPKLVRYFSRVFDENGQAKFAVVAEDDLEHPFIADSPSTAWREVFKKLCEKEGEKSFGPVSGFLRFGLAHPTVKTLLEEQKKEP